MQSVIHRHTIASNMIINYYYHPHTYHDQRRNVSHAIIVAFSISRVESHVMWRQLEISMQVDLLRCFPVKIMVVLTREDDFFPMLPLSAIVIRLQQVKRHHNRDAESYTLHSVRRTPTGLFMSLWQMNQRINVIFFFFL